MPDENCILNHPKVRTLQIYLFSVHSFRSICMFFTENVKEPPPVHRIVPSFSSPIDQSTPSHTPNSPNVKTKVLPKSLLDNMKREPGTNGETVTRFQMKGVDGTMKTYKIRSSKPVGSKGRASIVMSCRQCMKFVNQVA